MNICIYGAASDRIDESYKKEAWELGRRFAQLSIGVVFGGGATGMMGAAARGVRSVSSTCPLIGVAPVFFDKPGVLYENCSEMIWTETMRERKQKMEDLSDGFVVLPGGIGTFEEFFEILTLKQLGRHEKPIILYNINNYYDGIRMLMQKAVDERFMTEQQMEACLFADSKEMILDSFLQKL
ncbi:MAG: TIGR00730 family Rossman fold protein [Lachnospiraceae bacterium]|nr:TIGR00730 family Rossman fold protein [Lachnospiraceae bacterium]